MGPKYNLESKHTKTQVAKFGNLDPHTLDSISLIFFRDRRQADTYHTHHKPHLCAKQISLLIAWLRYWVVGQTDQKKKGNHRDVGSHR